VKALGESGVELELTVWIADPTVGEADLRSDLLKAVVRAFRENGLGVPYPRREVRLITPETREKPATTGT
jgi:small-conductance mechanosensitive channel